MIVGAFNLYIAPPEQRKMCFSWKITTLSLLQKNRIPTF